MKIEFTKATASGNDFVIIDSRNKIFDFNYNNFVKIACNRKFGIGADGVIFIEKDNDCDFLMRYFNSDGSEGSLCGNGARCASKYYSKYTNKKKLSFKAIGKKYESDILDNSVRLYLPDLSNEIKNYNFIIENYDLNAFFINTGSPHIIIFENEFKKIGDIQQLDVYKYGNLIRNHSSLLPDGSNINFVKIIDDNSIRIRTYERGVEDETLACGTGSIASAIISYLTFNMKKPIRILTQGGEIFIVNFDQNNTIIEKISLEGSAKLVFDGISFYDEKNNELKIN